MHKSCLLALSTGAIAIALGSGCVGEIPADFPSQAELYGDAPDYTKFDSRNDDYPGFVLRTTRETVFTARVDDGGIVGFGEDVGEWVNLGRYQDPDDRSIRGVMWGQRVDVQVAPAGDRAYGVVSGVLPVDVTASREAGALLVRGRIRGHEAAYRLDDKRLAGSLGRCSYDLARAGSHHYEGHVDCDGNPRLVRVRIPPELRRWTDAEAGAALGLLLGGG
ncbi:MAG: hypothetical protein IT372_24585 [Polyangiaceae bacterium]|nr:hypothetical protein [Polyangiaceae bacterium]